MLFLERVLVLLCSCRQLVKTEATDLLQEGKDVRGGFSISNLQNKFLNNKKMDKSKSNTPIQS